MYVSVGLTDQARDALRASTLNLAHLTAQAGRRLTMSEVLLSALRIAERHHAEWETDLTAPNE